MARVGNLFNERAMKDSGPVCTDPDLCEYEDECIFWIAFKYSQFQYTFFRQFPQTQLSMYSNDISLVCVALAGSVISSCVALAGTPSFIFD